MSEKFDLLVAVEREKLALQESAALVAELVYQSEQARDTLWASVLRSQARKLAAAMARDDYAQHERAWSQRAGDYIDLACARRSNNPADDGLRRHTQVLPPTLLCEHCDGSGIEPDSEPLRRCTVCRDGELSEAGPR